MGIDYIWDTNSVIYFLQNQLTKKATDFLEKFQEDKIPIISVITEIELLCWNTTSKKDLLVIESFIKDSHVVELNNSIKYKTAELRRDYKIKLPDAIIAASTIINDNTLITRNIKDFESIKDIKLLNIWD